MIAALTEAIAGAEQAVLMAAGPDAPALDDQVTLALAGGDPVPDAEVAQWCYLASLLANVERHELGLRVLQECAARAAARSGQARMHNLRGVLLAEAGRLAEARDAFQDALIDAADDRASAHRTYVNLAALTFELGDPDRARALAETAERVAPEAPADPRSSFTNHFTTLQIAFLREDRQTAADSLGRLSAACDELLGATPQEHPSATAAVADLAFAKFQAARLSGDPGQVRDLVAVLGVAAQNLSAGLGVDHPRVLAARARLLECELQVAVARRSEDACRRVLNGSVRTARLASARLGAGHPQTVASQAQAAFAQLALARLNGQAPGFVSAAEALQTVAADAGRVLGPTHPITVVALANGALAELEAACRSRSLGGARRAEDRLAVVAGRVGTTLGAAHSTTALIDRTLSACRRLVGAADADENGLDDLWRSLEASLTDGSVVRGETEALRERVWATIERIKQDDGVVHGEVIEVVKGGLIVDIGLRAFLPASLVEMRRVRDLHPYVGREIDTKIIELDKNRNNVVLSRRAWLEQTQSDVRTDFLTKLRKGQVRRGVVSSIVNFGAFVDLGGVDGLVHVSELSWRHIDHPSEVVRVGQEIEVEVLDVDLNRERVSLSFRATQEDPWRRFARTHAIGQIVRARVTKLTPFGAFVGVADGIEGLVHISELAERHVEIPEQAVLPGQEVFLKVLDIDLERHRVSLSLKQADEGFLEGEEHFDPTLYGMAATYDDAGNYIYPEGFDPETAEWLDGYEAQREAWEGQYAEAHDRWEGHARQVRARREADAEAEAVPPTSLPVPPPAAEQSAGTLSTDEALAALREKLTGGRG